MSQSILDFIHSHQLDVSIASSKGTHYKYRADCSHYALLFSEDATTPEELVKEFTRPAFEKCLACHLIEREMMAMPSMYKGD